MPLSDHEQRLLDDIEKALYADDPKFAATVRTAKRKRPRRPGRGWIPVAVLGVLVGLALVLLGLLLKNPVPGVAGFLLVVGAVVYGALGLRGGGTGGSPVDVSSLTDTTSRRGGRGAGGARAGRENPGGLRGRMEDRMRRRFDENGNG